MMRPKRAVPEAYRHTTVPANQTRQHIEDMLMQAGAGGVAWQSARTPTTLLMALRFAYRERTYRFNLSLVGTDAKTDKDRAQDERQRMRALYHGLKAMLNQDAFGIIRFEDAAVTWAEVALPKGGTTTVGEVIRDQLEQCRFPSLAAVLPALPSHQNGG